MSMIDPSDNWDRVELMRHQLGRLPQDGDGPLNIRLASERMAEAVKAGRVMPSSAASVIAYLGRLAAKSEENA